MIAPDLAAPGPRPAPPRAARIPDEAPADEAGRADAGSGDAEPIETKAEEDKPDFETVLDEDNPDAPVLDQAAAPVVQTAAPPVQVMAPAVDPSLVAQPPVSPPVPEIAKGEEVPTAQVTGAAPAITAVPTVALAATAAPPTAARPIVATPAVDAAEPADAMPEPARDPAFSVEPEPAPLPRAAAPIPTATPLPGSDGRIAAPAPDTGGAPGGLTLAPTGNADWRLSAHATTMAAPRDMATLASIQPQALAGQITLAVGKAVDRQVEIRLDPPELGRVHIHLTQTEHGLQAVVMAERPETHDLLRRHAEVLAKDLNAAGYDNVSLDFATGGRDTARDGDRRGSEQSFGLASGQAVAAIAPAVTPTRGQVDGALDIRL